MRQAGADARRRLRELLDSLVPVQVPVPVPVQVPVPVFIYYVVCGTSRHALRTSAAWASCLTRGAPQGGSTRGRTKVARRSAARVPEELESRASPLYRMVPSVH